MISMQTLQSGEVLRERSPDLGVAVCGTCGCLSPGQGLNPATRASLSQRWATQAEAEATFGILDWSGWQVMRQMSLQWTFHFPVSLGFCFVLCLLSSQTFNIVYCWNQLAGHLYKAFFHIYVQDGLIFVRLFLSSFCYILNLDWKALWRHVQHFSSFSKMWWSEQSVWFWNWWFPGGLKVPMNKAIGIQKNRA